MNLSHKSAAVLLAASVGTAVLAFSIRAQQQSSSASPPSPDASNSNLILLDPAHGASDTGATLPNSALEKDVTLAFAARIRGSLTSSGFTVVSTRDTDPSDPITPDQRAETANRTHALACIVLHATAAGSGVHIYTSGLPVPAPDQSSPGSTAAFAPILWDSAQSNFVAQSRMLASAIAVALNRDHLPALSARAALRPLDNLMCPAIAIELAPLVASNSTATSPADSAYQQQVAATLTNALRAWRDQSQQAAATAPNLDTQIAAQSKAIAAAEAAGQAASRTRAASAPATTPAASRGQP